MTRSGPSAITLRSASVTSVAISRIVADSGWSPVISMSIQTSGAGALVAVAFRSSVMGVHPSRCRTLWPHRITSGRKLEQPLNRRAEVELALQRLSALFEVLVAGLVQPALRYEDPSPLPDRLACVTGEIGMHALSLPDDRSR